MIGEVAYFVPKFCTKNVAGYNIISLFCMYSKFIGFYSCVAKVKQLIKILL